MCRASLWKSIGALAVILGLAVAPYPVRAIPVLQIDGNGMLTGVQDVQVGASAFDVTFVDGTCSSVYVACDLAHFPFSGVSDAVAAFTSLLEAIETSSVFPIHPELISGCATNTFDDCAIVAPYGFFISTETDVLGDYFAPSIGQERLTAFAESIATDTSFDPRIVYTHWDPVGVAEPSTIALFGFGLLCITGIWVRSSRRSSS